MAVVKLAYQEKGRFVAARVFPDSQVERKAAVQDTELDLLMKNRGCMAYM